MENNKKINEEFVQINIELHNLLAELEKLDLERSKILNSNASESEISEKMAKSIEDYENLLSKMKQLNTRSAKLKDKIKRKII